MPPVFRSPSLSLFALSLVCLLCRTDVRISRFVFVRNCPPRIPPLFSFSLPQCPFCRLLSLQLPLPTFFLLPATPHFVLFPVFSFRFSRAHFVPVGFCLVHSCFSLYIPPHRVLCLYQSLSLLLSRSSLPGNPQSNCAKLSSQQGHDSHSRLPSFSRSVALFRKILFGNV